MLLMLMKKRETLFYLEMLSVVGIDVSAKRKRKEGEREKRNGK